MSSMSARAAGGSTNCHHKCLTCSTPMHELDAASPAVTAVVASRNEDRHIEACIRSLLAQQEPPGGFEVIVADGMSDDQTRPLLQRLESEDQRLRVIDNPRHITSAGFNAGIKNARGRYIAFM